MLDEIYRVLNPRGVYICITYGTPKKRIEYLEKVKMQNQFNWKIFPPYKLYKPNLQAENLHFKHE